MPNQTVRLITENLAEERFLQAIFADRIKVHDVRVHSYLLESTAIGVAQKFLLERPDWRVALVLNTRTEVPEEVEDQRGILQRILASTAPVGWQVALAIPRLNAWVLADPRVRRDFESNEATDPTRDDPDVYYNQATRIGELVRGGLRFDPAHLREISEDYRELEDFINRHSRAPQPVAQGRPH